jgi:hypothetical protein
MQNSNVPVLVEAQIREASIYLNPCLGTPPLAIPSPLLFYGIQIAAGCLSLLILLVDPTDVFGAAP